MEAIDIMSTWRFTDSCAPNPGSASPGDTFTVTGLFVDEDGKTQATVKYDFREIDILVSAVDIRNMMESGNIERTNTSHEAWQARQ